MDRILQSGCSFIAMAGIGMIWSNLALAGPPGGRQIQGPLQNLAQHSIAAQHQEAQRQEAQRLDLRAPSPGFGEMSSASANFPSAAHRQIAGSDAMRLPALGNTLQSRNTMEDLARRVRHEGLPVARIFEGKSSLVHLGFNQKGKPGLWLVQKTH
jgi:hypothetical protein